MQDKNCILHKSVRLKYTVEPTIVVHMKLTSLIIVGGKREAEPVASNAMDEKGDSNPFGQSPLEGVVMKTQGKLLNIGTWNVRTLYHPGNWTI